MKIRIIFFLSLILLNAYLVMSLYKFDDISVKNGFLQEKEITIKNIKRKIKKSYSKRDTTTEIKETLIVTDELNNKYSIISNDINCFFYSYNKERNKNNLCMLNNKIKIYKVNHFLINIVNKWTTIPEIAKIHLLAQIFSIFYFEGLFILMSITFVFSNILHNLFYKDHKKKLSEGLFFILVITIIMAIPFTYNLLCGTFLY